MLSIDIVSFSDLLQVKIVAAVEVAIADGLCDVQLTNLEAAVKVCDDARMFL